MNFRLAISSVGYWWCGRQCRNPSDSYIAIASEFCSPVSSRMSAKPSAAATSINAADEQTTGAPPLESVGHEQPLHLARPVVQVLHRDPAYDLVVTVREQDATVGRAVDRAQSVEFGVDGLVATDRVDEAGPVDVTTLEPRPVLTDQHTEGVVVGLDGGDLDAFGHVRNLSTDVAARVGPSPVHVGCPCLPRGSNPEPMD